jgi:hypothetical protein
LRTALRRAFSRARDMQEATNDHAVLGKVAEELPITCLSNVWASKAIPWLERKQRGCSGPFEP